MDNEIKIKRDENKEQLKIEFNEIIKTTEKNYKNDLVCESLLEDDLDIKTPLEKLPL